MSQADPNARGPFRDEPPQEGDPVVIEFPDPVPGPNESRSERPGDAPEPARSGWSELLLSLLIPTALLASACLPLLFILRRPMGMVGWVGGLALTVGLLWIVTSVLWPGRAERGCPECREERLERLDPDSTIGVRCAGCGWSDPTLSSWLLAEEEGKPLETTVLRSRNRLPELGSDSDMDTGPGTD